MTDPLPDPNKMKEYSEGFNLSNMEDDDEDYENGYSFEDDDEGYENEYGFENKKKHPKLKMPRRNRMNSKDEVIFELEMNDPYSGAEDPYADELGEDYEEESEFRFGPMDNNMGDFEFDSEEGYGETYEYNDRMSMDVKIMEAIKKTIKPKGSKITKGSKSFKYGKTTDYPTVKQKEAFSGKIKAMGTGKPKFEFDDEVNMDGYSEKPRSPKKRVS